MLIHLSREGHTYGPYTAEEFEGMLSSGEVQHTDEVWVQSAEWEPLSHFERCFGHHEDCPPQLQRFGTQGAAVSPTPTPAAAIQMPSHRTLRSASGQSEEEGRENFLRSMLGV